MSISRQDQSQKNKKFYKWYINYNTIDRYEYLEGVIIAKPLLSLLSSLNYLPRYYIDKAESTLPIPNQKVQEALTTCEDLMKDILRAVDDFTTHANFNHRLTHLELFSRLAYATQQIKAGETLWDVFAPYAIDNCESLLSEEMLNERKKLTHPLYLKLVMQYTTKWLQNKMMDKLLTRYWNDRHARIIEELSRVLIHFHPDANQFSDLLKELINCQFPVGDFKLVLLAIDKQNSLDGITALLTNGNLLVTLKQHYLLESFLTFLTREYASTGNVLASQPKVLTHLSTLMNLNQFFHVINSVSLEENKQYQALRLDSKTDYFKVTLINGFDYNHCLATLLRSLENYRTQATLILYEALLRGDKKTVEILMRASTLHGISKTQFTYQSTANIQETLASEEHIIHATNTTFREVLSYTKQDFFAFMRQKYSLSNEDRSLFFISEPDEFLKLLVSIRLIKENDQEFRKFLSGQFQVQFNAIENETSDTTENSANELIKVKEMLAETQSKLEISEEKYTDLEKRYIEVLQRASELEFQLAKAKRELIIQNETPKVPPQSFTSYLNPFKRS